MYLFPKRKKTEPDLVNMDLNSIPMDALFKHYYSVWLALTLRINTQYPNIKAKAETPFSFFNFISNSINKKKPISVIDLGSNNCFLAYNISKITHPDSKFTCIDYTDHQPLYITNNVVFSKIDVFDFININVQKKYDYAILGAMLGLFTKEKQKNILEYVRTNCRYVYIREVPKITNLIDLICEKDLPNYHGWNNLTESELKALLKQNSLIIDEFEHEYDMYLLARPE